MMSCRGANHRSRRGPDCEAMDNKKHTPTQEPKPETLIAGEYYPLGVTDQGDELSVALFAAGDDGLHMAVVRSVTSMPGSVTSSNSPVMLIMNERIELMFGAEEIARALHFILKAMNHEQVTTVMLQMQDEMALKVLSARLKEF